MSSGSTAGDAVDASTTDYVADYYNADGEVVDSFALLEEHAPHLLTAYVDMRKAAFEQYADVEGRLSRKDRELVIIGMEVMARKNPPPTFHARKAVEAGATIPELVDVLGLCIMIGGMITYQDAGQFVLREALAHQQRLAGSDEQTSG
jgi:alkylhydroperoxidase/carboxymuconolactone decarboxylase family protein YurZ